MTADPKSTRYGGKFVHDLTDAVLAIADADVSAQVTKLTAAGANYAGQLANVQAISDAIQAEKAARGQ